jgi:hypothetical protein
MKMLRQVLDNLLGFLYRRNMRWYNSRISKEVSASIKNIKLQQDLKLQFKHVDDSLSRCPYVIQIAEDITKEIKCTLQY